MNRKMAHELTKKHGEMPGCFPAEPPETGPVNSSVTQALDSSSLGKRRLLNNICAADGAGQSI